MCHPVGQGAQDALTGFGFPRRSSGAAVDASFRGALRVIIHESYTLMRYWNPSIGTPHPHVGNQSVTVTGIVQGDILCRIPQRFPCKRVGNVERIHHTATTILLHAFQGMRLSAAYSLEGSPRLSRCSLPIGQSPHPIQRLRAGHDTVYRAL